jgi:hypothetical protein
LFRVLERFPELAHEVEVDACNAALEMLNPPMKSWGYYEFCRQRQLNAEREAASASITPTYAIGSLEWQAEQKKSG